MGQTVEMLLVLVKQMSNKLLQPLLVGVFTVVGLSILRTQVKSDF